MPEKNKNVFIIYQNLQSATALSFYQFITYSKKLSYCSIARSYLHDVLLLIENDKLIISQKNIHI
jgi:hypothetical protein